MLVLTELMEIYLRSQQLELSIIDKHKSFFARLEQGTYLLYLQLVKRIRTVLVNPTVKVNWVEFATV